MNKNIGRQLEIFANEEGKNNGNEDEKKQTQDTRTERLSYEELRERQKEAQPILQHLREKYTKKGQEIEREKDSAQRRVDEINEEIKNEGYEDVLEATYTQLQDTRYKVFVWYKE